MSLDSRAVGAGGIDLPVRMEVAVADDCIAHGCGDEGFEASVRR